MNQAQKTALALALSGLATTGIVSQANANPFVMQQLASGYQMSAPDGTDKAKEGKCGAEHKMKHEGKCGADKAAKKAMKEGKCGEGKCGAQMKAKKEGTCGAEHKMQHEGKCGAAKADKKATKDKTPL